MTILKWTEISRTQFSWHRPMFPLHELKKVNAFSMGMRTACFYTEMVPQTSYRIPDFVFYLSFSFCSFSFFSRSALASSSSCFLINCSTSFCLRTLMTVFPLSLVSVAISTKGKHTHLYHRQEHLQTHFKAISLTSSHHFCLRSLLFHDLCLT